MEDFAFVQTMKDEVSKLTVADLTALLKWVKEETQDMEGRQLDSVNEIYYMYEVAKAINLEILRRLNDAYAYMGPKL